MQVTSIPPILSIGLPVGRNAPVVEPATSMKLSSTGAAVPGTPSMDVSPSYVTVPPGVCTRARIRAPVFTALILTSVTSPLAAINPISSAAGPTPLMMLPQVGL